MILMPKCTYFNIEATIYLLSFLLALFPKKNLGNTIKAVTENKPADAVLSLKMTTTEIIKHVNL